MSRGGPEKTEGREQGLIFYSSDLLFAAANICFTFAAWSRCFLHLRSSLCCTDPVPRQDANGLPCRMCELLGGVSKGEKRGMGAFLSPDELAGTIRSKMQKNYEQLRELDIRFNDLQKSMKKKMKKKAKVKSQKGTEKQRSYEMQDVGNDSVASDALDLEHSNKIASIHKECLTVAERKLALAVQTYELIDSHIQMLDMNYFLLEEERKRDTSREAKGGAEYLDYNSDARLQEAGKGSKSSFDDDDERRYCYCNQFPYGEMIACDGPECTLEWFHFDCVGLKETPEGKWFCSECLDWKRQLGK